MCPRSDSPIAEFEHWRRHQDHASFWRWGGTMLLNQLRRWVFRKCFALTETRHRRMGMPRTPRRPELSTRPRLEELELRLVPASTWDGGSLVDNQWLTPANWAGDVLPNAGDSLVFP